MVQYTLDVAPSGKIPSGKTEIPFELPLKPRGNKPLYETYHGVFVSIQYLVRCDIKRSFLAKDVNKSLEFIIEDKQNNLQLQKAHSKIVFYKITPESLQNIRERSSIPKFLISGRLDSVFCKLSQPLTGEVKGKKKNGHSFTEIENTNKQFVFESLGNYRALRSACKID